MKIGIYVDPIASIKEYRKLRRSILEQIMRFMCMPLSLIMIISIYRTLTLFFNSMIKSIAYFAPCCQSFLVFTVATIIFTAISMFLPENYNLQIKESVLYYFDDCNVPKELPLQCHIVKKPFCLILINENAKMKLRYFSAFEKEVLLDFLNGAIIN